MFGVGCNYDETKVIVTSTSRTRASTSAYRQSCRIALHSATFRLATIPASHQECDYPMRNREWLEWCMDTPLQARNDTTFLPNQHHQQPGQYPLSRRYCQAGLVQSGSLALQP